MDKYDIDKLQRQALGAYLDAIERGSGVGRAKEGLAVVEGIVEGWLRERSRRERSARAPPCRCIVLRPGLDPQHGVLHLAILLDLKVKVWALAVAGVATRPNDVALLYDIAHIDKPVVQVAIHGHQAVTVINIHTDAVITFVAFNFARVFGSDDRAAKCGKHIFANGCVHVDTLVPSTWITRDSPKVYANTDAGISIPRQWVPHWFLLHHLPLAAMVAPNQTPPTIKAPTPAPASK